MSKTPFDNFNYKPTKVTLWGCFEGDPCFEQKNRLFLVQETTAVDLGIQKLPRLFERSKKNPQPLHLLPPVKLAVV